MFWPTICRPIKLVQNMQTRAHAVTHLYTQGVLDETTGDPIVHRSSAPPSLRSCSLEPAVRWQQTLREYRPKMYRLITARAPVDIWTCPLRPHAVPTMIPIRRRGCARARVHPQCTAIRVPCERPGPARLKISTQTTAKLQPVCDPPNSSKDAVFFVCPQPFHDAE